MASCEGCDKPLGVVESLRYTVCMECTIARHRKVTKHGGMCKCGRKRRPGDLLDNGARSWIPCRRCLGTIKQVS
jgi:hypothetical protein